MSSDLEQYIYESSDKKSMIKLEFHCDMLNNIKITLKSKDTKMTNIVFLFETQFDLDAVKQISEELNKYIENQDNIIRTENLKQIRLVCKHLKAMPSHPYGDLWCPDCKKLV